MSENNKLKVVEMSEEQLSTSEFMDDRHYRTIYVVPVDEDDGGAISTAKPHGRNIWNRQPMNGRPNPFYDAIVAAMEKNGQAIIKGRIETVQTNPYYIESEQGKFEHPKTGKPANKATEKTYVLFEDETADRFLRNDNLTRKDEKTEQEAPFQANQTLVAENFGEEAEEEVDVS